MQLWSNIAHSPPVTIAPPRIMPMCFLSKNLTLSPSIWWISPPLTSMEKITYCQGFSPELNFPWAYSPWLNSSWNCSSKLNYHLYGASSCKYKTYNISILKHSFWSRNLFESLAKILKGFPWKRFCKYVYHSLFCAHIFNYDVLFCNLFL